MHLKGGLRPCTWLSDQGGTATSLPASAHQLKAPYGTELASQALVEKPLAQLYIVWSPSQHATSSLNWSLARVTEFTRVSDAVFYVLYAWKKFPGSATRAELLKRYAKSIFRARYFVLDILRSTLRTADSLAQVPCRWGTLCHSASKEIVF